MNTGNSLDFRGGIKVEKTTQTNKQTEKQKTREEERDGREGIRAMADIFAWLLSFFLLIAVLGILLYQLMCLADLEFDYINPYDSASRINKAVWPEFITQGSLCFLHLITGHWFMFLVCLPYSYYNFRLYSITVMVMRNRYTKKQHLVDVTEIFNQLPWEKKLRIYKLVYLVVCNDCGSEMLQNSEIRVGVLWIVPHSCILMMP
ncbi:unnamed protein product [Camellia sinensis]